MSRSATRRLQQLNERGRGPASQPPSFRPPGADDQVVSRFAFGVGTFLVFAVIAAIAVLSGYRSIENDIEARSLYALQVTGFHDIDVAVDGFDVTLQGFYYPDQSPEDAVAVVSALDGVGTVDSSGVFAVEITEIEPVEVEGAPIRFTWSAGALTVSGDVSKESVFDYLANHPLTFTDGDDNPVFRSVDTTDLHIVEDLAPVPGLSEEQEWVGSAVALLRTLAAGLDEGYMVVNPAAKLIQTSGEVLTRKEKEDITEAGEEFTLALEGHGFDISPGIILPEFVATQEEVEEVTRTLTELIGDKVVEFELNSAALTPEGRALLDDILEELRKFPNVTVEIAGHADASGTPEHNLVLSQERAQAVLDYFVANGEDPNRYIVVGYGDTRPISPEATPEQNRRIEFIPQEA